MSKTIPLDEAFRVVLRRSCPNQPALANEINSYSWFHYFPKDPTTKEPTPAAKAAFAALEIIREALNAQQIRLRGCLDGPPIDIDPIDIAWNGVHVFDRKVEVYDRGRTVRTYVKVHCYEAEIEALSSPPPPLTPAKINRHKRFSTDDRLAREIVDGLGTRWASVHKGAEALVQADKAEGNATTESKVRRLEGKASKLLQTSQNISKDE